MQIVRDPGTLWIRVRGCTYVVCVEPFIVATDALSEGLRCNEFSAIEAKLECVTAFGPTDVVGELVQVLDR